MDTKARRTKAASESGSALLIAIFALLLISVMGIALLVSTGSDSALAGNYRNSMGAYYAAVAGLEEGRGRLLLRNSNFLNKTNAYPTAFNGPTPTFGQHDVLYIVNPAAGETVNPTDPANPYYDKEYATEFPGGANVLMPFVPSVSPAPGASPTLPGPPYKWVRINPLTEQAINLDVNGNGTLEPGVLFYDPAHVDSSSQPKPGLVVSSSSVAPSQPTPSSLEALEITALAVMADKSTKLLQYVLTPLLVFPNLGNNAGAPALGFPAALTLLGNSVQYTGPGNGNFYIRGQDQCGGSTTMVPAIGFANNGDAVGSSQANIFSGATPAANYQGAPVQSPGPPPTPSNQSVLDVTDPEWSRQRGARHQQQRRCGDRRERDGKHAINAGGGHVCLEPHDPRGERRSEFERLAQYRVRFAVGDRDVVLRSRRHLGGFSAGDWTRNFCFDEPRNWRNRRGGGCGQNARCCGKSAVVAGSGFL
jgi:hypothetical protein